MTLYPGDRVHLNMPKTPDRRHDAAEAQAVRGFYRSMGVEVAYMTFTENATAPTVVAVFRRQETT